MTQDDEVVRRIEELRSAGRLDEARAALDDAMGRADGGAPASWQLLYGRVLAEQGRFEDAETRLALAISGTPRTDEDRRARPSLCIALAELLVKLGRVNEAAAQYRRALAIADQTSGRESVEAALVARTVATFYRETKQLEDARRALERSFVALARVRHERATEAREELEAVLGLLGKPGRVVAPAPAAPPEVVEED